MQGTVVSSFPDRGFFFIRPAGGTRADSHFAHVNDWGIVPNVGDVVEFDSHRGERGLVAKPGVK